MLFKGLLITNLSGSVDGLTASHNRGGAYIRSRVTPVDPNTTKQGFCRSAMAAVSTAWDGLTGAERAAWAAYARTTSIPNRIGDQHTLSGRNAFFQFVLPHAIKNFSLDAGNETTEFTPPPATIPDFPSPPSVASVDATHVHIIWPSPMGWEELTADAGMTGIILHLSGPQKQTINWFRGPYIPAFWLEADEDTPPSSPFNADLSVSGPSTVPAMITGKRYFYTLRLFWENHTNGHVFTGSFDTSF